MIQVRGLFYMMNITCSILAPNLDSIDAPCSMPKYYIAQFKSTLGSTPNWHPITILRKFNFKRFYSKWPAKQKSLIPEDGFKNSLKPGNYDIDEKKKTTDSLFRQTLGRFSKINLTLSRYGTNYCLKIRKSLRWILYRICSYSKYRAKWSITNIWTKDSFQ